jgi:hypothetical protein
MPPGPLHRIFSAIPDVCFGSVDTTLEAWQWTHVRFQLKDVGYYLGTNRRRYVSVPYIIIIIIIIATVSVV